MGKAIAAPGFVKETVTQERFVAEETNVSPARGMETDEYIAGLSEEQWKEHVVYLYRKYPAPADGAGRTYIAKFSHFFDEEWLQRNFGGGTYHYILKKGSQRLKEGDLSVEGNPRISTSTHGGGASQGELVQALELVLNKVKQPDSTQEVTMLAFKNALEMQRAAMPAPMTFEQMTNALVNLDKMRSSNTGGGSLETNPIVKSLMEAALPALGALLTKLLTPTDPLAAIQTATNTFKTIQELGGGGGGKDDIGTTVVKNLPALLERGGSILAELRAMEELRRNNLILMSQRNPAAIVPATHVTPANPAAPAAPLSAVPGIAPAAPIVITPDSEGRPSPEWVFRQIVAMVNKGDSGGFVFDFLDSMELSLEVGGKAVLLVDIIHGATLEQVRDFIGKDPILGVLAQSPRYEEFCKEFHAALSAREPKQPLPN